MPKPSISIHPLSHSKPVDFAGRAARIDRKAAGNHLVNTALAILLLTGCATGRVAHETDSRESGRYAHLMHNRFYEAWIQPKALALSPGKISVPVDVQIDRSGRVLRFKIVKPSGNQNINNSIAAVGKKVTQVTPPPLPSRQRRFDLRIYFELDVKP